MAESGANATKQGDRAPEATCTTNVIAMFRGHAVGVQITRPDWFGVTTSITRRPARHGLSGTRPDKARRVPVRHLPACVLLLRPGHSFIDQASSSSWRRLLVVEALHRVAGKVRGPLGDSRRGHGNYAQLLQHAELVPADPVFAPQVVLEAADDDCSDLDGFSGGRNAHELGLLGSRCDHAPHDLVVVGDHILDRPMEIGKGCAERTNEFQESLRPRAEVRRQLSPRVGGREYMGLLVDVALVPSLFEPGPYGCFVLLCSHLYHSYLEVHCVFR